MGLSLYSQHSCGKVTTLAQENEMTAEQQLKAFQTDYREHLSSRYGLDPVSVSAIPLGSVKEMESHARLLQKAVKPDKPKVPAQVPFDRSPLSTVNSYLSQKYKGPQKRG